MYSTCGDHVHVLMDPRNVIWVIHVHVFLHMIVHVHVQYMYSTCSDHVHVLMG